MPRTPARADLPDRLLAELVRVREESAGHPEDASAADAAAIRAGGSLEQRIHARALALPGSQALRTRVRRVLATGWMLAAGLWLVAAASGAGVASAALNAAYPASVPLVLLVVVGINVLMLAIWLLAQLLMPRVATGLAAALRALWQRFSAPDPNGPAHSTLALLTGGAMGRWLLGSLLHAAWLVFSVAALATLVILLSVRAYDLAWETTLLSTDALAAWANALSWGPALLGAAVDELSVADTVAAAHKQAWSYWLLAAVLAYGVLPRAAALVVCLLLLWRAQAALGRDLTRPGFARLRTRLLADYGVLPVSDPAPTGLAPVAEAQAPLLNEWPPGRLHGVSLDGAASVAPVSAHGEDCEWLGAADDAAVRDRILQHLAQNRVDLLAVVVRAAATPDRGGERLVAELVAAARAPALLVLADFQRLRARGEPTCQQRLADWRALAWRAGARHGVLPWAAPGDAP